MAENSVKYYTIFSDIMAHYYSPTPLTGTIHNEKYEINKINV